MIAVVRICDLPVTWFNMSDTPAKPSQVTYLSLQCIKKKDNPQFGQDLDLETRGHVGYLDCVGRTFTS